MVAGAGADAGMARHVFFSLSNWDGAPLGVGALCKLRTMYIGSGGTVCAAYLHSMFLFFPVNDPRHFFPRNIFPHFVVIPHLGHI